MENVELVALCFKVGLAIFFTKCSFVEKAKNDQVLVFNLVMSSKRLKMITLNFKD